jgi:5-methylcytosine-specific restriction endonuclease McrA
MSNSKLLALKKRDGNLCQICFSEVDFSLLGTNHKMAPSADHIIPKSRGGTGVMANLRLTHASCNNKRGNGPSASYDIVLEAFEHFAHLTSQ